MSIKANISSISIPPVANKAKLFSNQATYFLPTPTRTSVSRSQNWKYYHDDQDSDIEPTAPTYRKRRQGHIRLGFFGVGISVTKLHFMVLYAVILILFTATTFLLTMINSCPEAKLYFVGRKGRVQRIDSTAVLGIWNESSATMP